jgi:hypothetical protein
VDLFEGEVFEVDADVLREGGGEVVADHLGFLLAVGALEVGEDDDDDGGAGGAVAGLEVGFEEVEILLEGVLGGVEDGALDDLGAGFGDVELLGLAGGAEGAGDGDGEEAVDGGGYGVGDGDGDLFVPDVEVADVGLEGGFSRKDFWGGGAGDWARTSEARASGRRAFMLSRL